MKYCQRIDRETALKRSQQIGKILWKLGYRKDVIFKNLNIAFPDKDYNWKVNVAQGTLKNIGRVLVEFPKIPEYVKTGYIDEIFEITSGREIAYEYSKDGVILVTGHIGNWEILGAGLQRCLKNVVALAYRQENEKVNQILKKIRNQSGIEIIHHNDPMRKFVEAIKNKKTLAFLIDQNTLKKRGMFVDFFGVPAITVTFPAKLAVKHKKPVLFAYTVFDEKTKKYKCEILPLQYKIEDDEQTVCNIVKAYTKKVEEVVKRYPDQYLWTHKRWKTRPQGEPSIY